MPKPKNQFAKGKQGLAAAGTQYSEAITAFTLYMQPLNNRNYQDALNYRNRNLGSLKEYKGKTKDNRSNYVFKYTLESADVAEKHRKKLKDLKKRLRNLNQTPSENINHFAGYLTTVDRMLDTESGDFGRILTENAYIANMLSMFHNGPKINDQIPIETSIRQLKDTDPDTGKDRGPLVPLNNYFVGLARLIDAEYAKQDLEEDYSEKKEQDYLLSLEQAFSFMIKNHEAFENMVGDDGKSKYDPYLMQKLDVMTRKNPSDSLSRRDCKRSIENIKGQHAAILNGWGAFELDLPGQISELAFLVEKEREAVRASLNPQKLAQRVQNIENRITSLRNSMRETANQIEEAKNQLRNLEANHAGEVQIQQARNTLENLKSNLALRGQELERTLTSRGEEPVRQANLRERLRSYEKLSEDLRKLDQKTKNTKIRYNTEKYEINDELIRLTEEIQNNKFLDEAIKKEAQKAKGYAKTAMQFAGKKRLYEYIDPEFEKMVIQPDEYKEANAFSNMTGKFQPGMAYNSLLVKNGWEPIVGFFERAREAVGGDDFELKRDMGEMPYTGWIPGANQFQITNNFRLEDEDIKEVRRASKEQQRIVVNLHEEALEKQTDEARDCIRIDRVTNKLSNEAKGYFVQAVSEQPYITCFFTQINGAVPKTYNPQLKTDVKRFMLENNAMEPLLKFYEGGGDLLEAEYSKHKMRQTGWDAGKERLYKAKLYEGAKKSLENYRKLVALPASVQNDNRFLDNEISHITGATFNATERDISLQAIGLEWMIRGIENGWDSENLVALQAGGWMEGSLFKAKNKLEDSIRAISAKKNPAPKTEDDRKKENDRAKEEENFRKTLTNLKNWEDRVFKPFKKRIFDRQINTSSDMLRSLTEIQEFHEMHKNDPEVKNVKVTSSRVIRGCIFSDCMNAMNQYALPTAMNRCLQDINDQMSKGVNLSEVRKETVPFKICDKKEEMKAFLGVLKEHENLERDAKKAITTEYLQRRFLHGKNEDAHPELFDSKHPDYAITNRKLMSYLEQYADRLMTLCEGDSEKELAELLENGNFENTFYEIKERLDAEAAKGRMDAFIAGRPERNKKDMNLSSAMEQMKNSHAAWGSSNGLYDNILGDMKDLEAQRGKFTNELMGKFRTEFHAVKEGDNTRFVLPEDVTINEKKLSEYLKAHEKVLADIDRYLEGKHQIIREKGGNPDNLADASRLGRNGERRYKAMLDAKKAVMNEYLAAKEFVNNGISDVQRQILKLPPLRLDQKEYFDEREPLKIDFAYDKKTFNLQTDGNNPDAYNKVAYDKAIEEYRQKKSEAFEKFKTKEKGNLLEFAKYNATDRIKDFENRMNAALEEEAGVRRRLVAGKGSMEKEAYETALATSAKRSLFLESIREKFDRRKKEIYKTTYKKIIKDAVKEFRIAKLKYDQEAKDVQLKEKFSGIPPTDEERQKLENLRTARDNAEQKMNDLKANEANITKEIDKGVNVRFVMEKVELGKMSAEVREYEKVIRKLSSKGSKTMENFEKEVMQKDPFKDNFATLVVQEAEKDSFDRYSISQIRDRIITDAVKEKGAKLEESEKLKQIVSLTGSKVDVDKIVGRPVAPALKIPAPKAPIMAGPV